MNTVLITGANHGLGLSLVKIFLENEYRVFAGIYKMSNDAQINALKDDTLKNKGNLHFVNLDISDLNTIEEAASYIEAQIPSLDILINNAGIIGPDDTQSDQNTILKRLDFESIANVININAIGTLRVANIFAHLLIKGDKRLLVNISSEAGSITNCERDRWFGYCMSKAALNMAGTIMHNELKKHNGQVLQIDPGYMQTYMHGYKNVDATYPPDFSAKNIFEQVKKAEHCKSEKAIYIDLFGNKVDW